MLIDIRNAFQSNPIPGASTNQIRRIIAAYKKSIEKQRLSPPCYQVSREWLPIYQEHLQDVLAALNEEKVDSLKAMYENFFREELSTGLHGLHFEMVEKYMDPKKSIADEDLASYMENVQRYALMFLRSNPQTPLDILRRPPVGNPYGYTLDGTQIYVGAEYHWHYSNIIRKLLRDVASPVVFELGGGFGGMAYYLMRDSPRIQYIAADLPENAALQAYYLLSHFPEKKIALFGEFEFGDATLKDCDAIILPNFAIESLKEDSVNLSFNSYSLAEMDLVSIKNYLSEICRFTSQYIYHVNHVVWPVSADGFPLDNNKYELFFRFPTMWGRDIEDCKIDHHDFLYARSQSRMPQSC